MDVRRSPQRRARTPRPAAREKRWTRWIRRALGLGCGLTLAGLFQLLAESYEVQGRKSAQNIGYALRALTSTGQFAPDTQASSITPAQLQQFARARLEAGLTRASVRGTLALLKSAYSNALRLEVVDRVPTIPLPPKARPRVGYFSAAEIARLLPELPPVARAVVLFAYVTGWRRGEIVSLTWSQVDWERETVGATDKNGEPKGFPFGAHPALAEMLRTQRSLVPWVFHRDGEPIRSIRTSWEKACARAGMPGRRFHDLKRSARRNLRLLNVDEQVSMKLLGHRTAQVHRDYDQIVAADLLEAVAKLGAQQEGLLANWPNAR